MPPIKIIQQSIADINFDIFTQFIKLIKILILAKCISSHPTTIDLECFYQTSCSLEPLACTQKITKKIHVLQKMNVSNY